MASSLNAYDSAGLGNITVNNEFGGGSYSYGSARPHMVKSANGVAYTCDVNGNVTSRGAQILTYDVNNHLSQVVAANGVSTTFGYDASGQRLWEQTASQPLKVWIGDLYEENNGKVLFNIMANGRRVCSFEPAAGGSTGYDPSSQEFYYYHPDYLGSSSLMTERNGTQVQNYEYSAFGQSRYTQSSTAFAVSHRFTGQILDYDTGFYYYNARYYDPQLGRFLQPDDIIPDLFNPQSYNRYSYCVNNPLRYTDPTGHWGQEVADWWSGTVGSGANYISASPSHWIYNGTVGTVNSLVGGVAEPLRLGSTAGALSGSGNATAGQIALGTVQEVGRAAAIVPVGAAIGKGVGTLAGAVAGTAESEAAGAVASQVGNAAGKIGAAGKAGGAAEQAGGAAAKLSKVEKSSTVEEIGGGKFTKTTDVRPGKGPGQSRAEYVRYKNEQGETIKTYKDSFDRANNFQGRKPLRGGPEGRPQNE